MKVKSTLSLALAQFPTLKSTEAATGGLAKASKMPGASWSISAKRCAIGRMLAQNPGSPCYFCYALKGRYVFPVVQAALERRYSAWRDSPQTWERGMIAAIYHLASSHGRKHSTPYAFRWFDSGDVQGVGMLQAICRIAEALPAVRFWLPTQERGTLQEFQGAGGRIPHNLTVRVSSARVDKAEPKRRWTRKHGEGWIVSSMVTTDPAGRPAEASLCPAPEQKNTCGDCRRCWDGAGYPLVAYRAH